MVIVDTSIWVTALGRRDSEEKRAVGSLIQKGEAALVGIVLVEILRGARNQSDFDRLRRLLLGAALLETSESCWFRAAGILLDLKLRGEVIPAADAIIAGQALEDGHSVYTIDRHFQRVSGLPLYSPNAG